MKYLHRPSLAVAEQLNLNRFRLPFVNVLFLVPFIFSETRLIDGGLSNPCTLSQRGLSGRFAREKYSCSQPRPILSFHFFPHLT